MRPIPALSLLLAASAVLSAQAPVSYPPTRKLDVVDTYHGVQVADPYRWLEDDQSLDTIPERPAIQARMTKLWNYEKYGAPTRHGKFYAYTYNSGLQNQSVLYVTEKLEEKGRILLDPNTLSAKGTVALNGMGFSPEGKHLAYGLSNAGSDWVTWKVRDVATGKDLPDTLEWSKFSGAAWDKAGTGFYYGRYDAPKGGSALTGVNKFQKIYFHKLGTPQDQDTLVFERPDQPDWGFKADLSDDGRWLIIEQTQGTERRNRVFIKDLTKPDSAFQALFGQFDAQYVVLGNDGDTFYVQTDFQAPKGRVVAVDVKTPGAGDWKEVIPQSQQREVIASSSLIGNTLAVTWRVDALNRVKLYDLKGKLQRDLKRDAIGTLDGFAAKRSATEVFFTFNSFNQPPTIYRYDLKRGKESVFRSPKVDLQPSDFEVRQVFYPSKDGTKVPMFIAHKKGLKLDGTNPTLLYGYGGFNSPRSPNYSPATQVWMEMGGVYALACIRGGNEYGKEWWEQGKRETKQNTFDDFIAAGEYLISQKITTTPKLAIQGGSNGGLLVGACLTQRPDLFGAALPAVGVLDMLRYHKFTIGWAWQSDYMCSEDKAGFENLIKYSPLHTLKPGTKYPATLVTTGDHDDRVVPAHSHKFTATLQAAQAGPAPILTRIETDAGHGAGKPTGKRISEATDIFGFLVKNLGFKLPEGFGK